MVFKVVNVIKFTFIALLFGLEQKRDPLQNHEVFTENLLRRPRATCKNHGKWFYVLPRPLLKMNSCCDVTARLLGSKHEPSRLEDARVLSAL